MKLSAATLAALAMIIPYTSDAQSRPPQVRGSGGVGVFFEAEEQIFASGAWRKYIGTRRKTFSLLLLVEGFSRRGV